MLLNKTIYICDRTLDHISIYSENWKKLNPDYTIELYDNQRCEEFLLNCFDEMYVQIFKSIPDGPIKADFWRVCIIYYYGGIYVDADCEPFIPLDDFLENDVELVTCSSYWKYQFNPNFIVANKKNAFLKKCIDYYINKFKFKVRYSYWGWSIMETFNLLKLKDYNKNEGIYESEYGKVQIIQECSGKHHCDAHNMYKNVRLFNNRYSSWDAGKHQFN